MSFSSLNNDCAVIIVTYNNREDIPTCLRSLSRADPDARLQVIVVDNASPDGTGDWLHAFQARQNGFAAFQFIKNRENRGFTRAVNQALAYFNAEMVLFLNPDTELPEQSLARLRAFLHNHPDIQVIAPQFRNPDGTVQPSCRRFPRHRDILFSMMGLDLLFPRSKTFNGWKMGDFDHCSGRFVDQPQGAFLLARKEVIRTVGAWDERYPMFFSDVDWCYRVWQAGFRIYFWPEVFVIHHKGKSISADRPAMILSSHRSFIRYFWKTYRNWYSVVPNLLVTSLLLSAAPIRFLLAKLGDTHA